MPIGEAGSRRYRTPNDLHHLRLSAHARDAMGARRPMVLRLLLRRRGVGAGLAMAARVRGVDVSENAARGERCRTKFHGGD